MLGLALLGGIIFLSRDTSKPTSAASNNISSVDGKQVIEIKAKGGYAPTTTVAKANIPTLIKMKTQGTFDCSSSLLIPTMGYRANLPASGETLIEVPPQQTGSVLQGLCSMGMYNFSIQFN